VIAAWVACGTRSTPEQRNAARVGALLRGVVSTSDPLFWHRFFPDEREFALDAREIEPVDAHETQCAR